MKLKTTRNDIQHIATNAEDVYTQGVRSLPLWCSWLTRRILNPETTGSNPVSGILKEPAVEQALLLCDDRWLEIISRVKGRYR